MSGYTRADELCPGVVRMHGCLWRVTEAQPDDVANTVNLSLGLLGNGSRQVTLPADRLVSTTDGEPR